MLDVKAKIDEALPLITEIYAHVDAMNLLAIKLKGLDIQVYLAAPKTREDPLGRFCTVNIAMRTGASPE